jgi:hypothetical protein
MSWNPEEREGITKISMAARNLRLPDIFIVKLCVLRVGKTRGKPHILLSVELTDYH